MTARAHDPWDGAKCREPQWWEWARQHRGSYWDAKVDGETAAQQKDRHFKATGICFSCDLRAACRERHEQLTHATGERVPGVWGGKVFAEYSPANDNTDYLPFAA
ncbi:hypothetical protein [Nocardia sp. CC227C]|uniref:hypothetical protein n=1 Tax=Nocardia sp. CC227C TaxID=3044562 RepID=UPI00278BCA16|nr:hypothetical protein [Nocardia sp. CC227C]